MTSHVQDVWHVQSMFGGAEHALNMTLELEISCSNSSCVQEPSFMFKSESCLVTGMFSMLRACSNHPEHENHDPEHDFHVPEHVFHVPEHD